MSLMAPKWLPWLQNNTNQEGVFFVIFSEYKIYNIHVFENRSPGPSFFIDTIMLLIIGFRYIRGRVGVL
jgi:hypothetical protein